jgi:hypothetical protein
MASDPACIIAQPNHDGTMADAGLASIVLLG